LINDLLIVCKDNSYGLSKDSSLLQSALNSLNSEKKIQRAGIRERRCWDRLFRKKLARQAVHIERVFPRFFSAADRHILIPNQERFPRRHVNRLKKIDLVLAKSKHALEIFRSLGAKAEYLGFTSDDKFDATLQKDWSGFLHLGGGSTLKGSEDILSLWEKHPEWPLLTLIYQPKRLLQNLPANVKWINTFIDDRELQKFQNRLGVHLCPSRSEGWGHHLVESMSVGALIIATDAPPMNELVNSSCALMVPYVKSEPRRLGTNFYVDIAALEQAILSAIKMPNELKAELGKAARAAFVEIDRGFRERVKKFFFNYL